MQIPSKTQCCQLIREMEMLEHIVAHSVLVCRVALFLTDQLTAQHIHLNRSLIEASALLHDITKTRSFITGESHALTGAQMLRDMGYPEVGDIIQQHVWLNTYLDSEPPTEAEIVNYADKRVLHDQVASLEDRMGYILEKYGKEPEHRKQLRLLWKQADKLENKLFRWLDFSPKDIEELLAVSC